MHDSEFRGIEELKMPDLSPTAIAVLGSLGGVVLGVFLGEGVQVIRYHLHISLYKRIIGQELESIKYQIDQKMDIVNKVMERLERRASYMPARSVPIQTIAYDESIREIYGHLSNKQRNCLHVIYARLKVADDFMDSYEQSFISAVKDRVIDDPFQAYYDLFANIFESYQKVTELIESYLADEPVDVYSIEEGSTTANKG